MATKGTLTAEEARLLFSSKKPKEEKTGDSKPESVHFSNQKEEPTSSAPSKINEEDLQPIAGTWQKLEGFENPIKFALFFDDKLMRPDENGQLKPILHPWQIEVGESFGNVKPTSKHPYKFCLCAANGSGKDAFVVTPFAVWFICCKIKSTVIITSASGLQLTNQTENLIAGLCRKVNEKARAVFGQDIIKIRKRRITCLLSGSEIMLFATDEAGKAEGYHPVEIDSEMAIIVNEAKNVTPEIFGALRRCTGFNYWLDVSTPGQKKGDFFQHWQYWPNRRRVTYYDCPHQAPDEFEYDKKTLGEHDPLFRSKWLALFNNSGGKSVINELAFERMIDKQQRGEIVHHIGPIRIGLDVALSTHGDETVISVWNGNKQLAQYTHRIKDAVKLAANIQQDLLKHVGKNHPYIFGDDGNVGRAVMDILKAWGWTGITRVLNQSASKNKKTYRNRGAEMWHKFAKLIENECLILLPDEKLHEQICNRRFKESDTGIDRLLLESKQSAAASGDPSPDRADAAVLAFCGVSIDDLIHKVSKPIEKAKGLSGEEQLRKIEREMYMIELGKVQPQKRTNNVNLGYSIKRLGKVSNQNSRLLKWK